MQDIKIPDPHQKKSEFEVKELSHPAAEATEQAPAEKVKVKFSKFVQLIATHDFEEVMKRHEDEDVVLSTNLLTDLANAHEEQQGEGKKLPIIFIVGIIVGIAVTYFIIRY